MLNVTELSGFGAGGSAATEPHRYWRVIATQPITADEGFEISELEFRTVATGVAALGSDDLTSFIAYGATPITDVNAWNYPAFSSPSVGVTVPAYQPRSCFDNYTDGAPTFWADPLGSDYVGAYVGYDFVTPVVVREVLFVSASVDGPVGLAVEYSDDKINWHVSKEFRDTRISGVTYWPSRFRVFTLF